MSRCGDSPRAGIVGCGVEWSGTTVAHCVARAPWSTHPDGRCHHLFSSNYAADKHWVGEKRGSGGRHMDPAEVPSLVLVVRANGLKVWTTGSEAGAVAPEVPGSDADHGVSGG